MPATVHDSFKPPANSSARIWRYMDFTKFVFMLETSSLWFSRTDKLGDPFEGSIPQLNILQEESWLASLNLHSNITIDDVLRTKRRSRKVWRTC